MSYITKIKERLDLNDTLIKDSVKGNSHSIDAITDVQQIMYQETLARRVAAGQSFQSLDEMKADIKVSIKDSFVNPMTGIGTAKDPGIHTVATIPLALSPFEATAIYSSGGLPEIIINKKSKGILINGYNFVSDNKFWVPDKLRLLKEGLDSTGFEGPASDALRDGLIYGGATTYPTLKGDTALSYSFTGKDLAKMLGKGCILRWNEVDRWNTSIIPVYDPTAEDYLSAKHYYVPISGINVAAERSAMIRPKKLPYWGAIMQLGWGISDFEGYMRSIYAYEILIASVPIMAQQMSLLMYEIPLDGMIASMGADEAKKFMGMNDEAMREWSMANPKTINALGKVYSVNRQYTGYSDLGNMLRQDIGAQSGLPEAILFHTQPKGFSNNTEEIMLKQSETVKLSQKQIAPEMTKVRDLTICHVFGYGSDEWNNRQTVAFTFDNPMVATESERAEAAARAAATINSLRQAGVPLKEAIQFTQKFFKYITIDNEILNAAEERDTTKVELEIATAEQTLENMKVQATEEKKSQPVATEKKDE